jgi:hypothetical protein
MVTLTVDGNHLVVLLERPGEDRGAAGEHKHPAGLRPRGARQRHPLVRNARRPRARYRPARGHLARHPPGVWYPRLRRCLRPAPRARHRVWRLAATYKRGGKGPLSDSPWESGGGSPDNVGPLRAKTGQDGSMVFVRLLARVGPPASTHPASPSTVQCRAAVGPVVVVKDLDDLMRTRFK